MTTEAQIHCPDGLPQMLKQFTKAAIRTQPPDVLAWSAAYFTAMNEGSRLPVKKRVEPPAPGLTPGLIDMVLSAFDGETDVAAVKIERRWKEIGLQMADFDNIMKSGQFSGNVNLMNFTAMASRYMGRGSIGPSLRMACLILTKDEEGGANSIPLDTFKTLYEFMAKVFGEETQVRVENVMAYIQEEADKQEGMVKPRNFLHPDCPSLS